MQTECYYNEYFSAVNPPEIAPARKIFFLEFEMREGASKKDMPNNQFEWIQQSRKYY